MLTTAAASLPALRRGSFVMDALPVKYRQSIAVNLFLPLPGRAA